MADSIALITSDMRKRRVLPPSRRHGKNPWSAHISTDRDETLQYLATLDALTNGSGWLLKSVSDFALAFFDFALIVFIVLGV